MTGIDEVALCDNKAKNVGIAIATARLFNEVSVQMNESKLLGYFFTSPKCNCVIKKLILTLSLNRKPDCLSEQGSSFFLIYNEQH